MRRRFAALILAGLALIGGSAVLRAQEDTPPASLTKPAAGSATPAKLLFGAVKEPADLAPRGIGFYSRGCLAGGEALPINGPTWQAMRLSRNRNWGHPDLVAFLEQLAAQAPKVGWPGLLVGDMAQPRGGPMATGHASHQIGLDADIWLTPMPKKVFTAKEREEVSATMIVRPDRLDVDAKVWTPAHVAIIRTAAQDERVERVLVNAAIKKALCRDAKADRSGDRAWLQKVRPYWGHDYHMHVRISCPTGSPDCRPQEPVVAGDGCDKLDWWFSEGVLHPKPPKVPPKPAPPLTLAQLPPACAAVLKAP
ncbi:penicillin-insensitive murein endopeptidase [Ancylobacter sp. 3268]|uniref:penicillin-insensitive murein endopeptidase n=1 Tax=Ancylobacter sp. 3268 TaxID=2817752 RepID=UPI002862FBC1|nr:penicillin-insensitive murein endopeptidase [Ancylobacter sp. 3268]MDR6953711.1 penicillin-insensitive murein endopeptidase [Ancylobacter sp. 3268]